MKNTVVKNHSSDEFDAVLVQDGNWVKAKAHTPAFHLFILNN